MSSSDKDVFHSGPPGTLPAAYCWVCKDDVVVWADFPDGAREGAGDGVDAPVPRCIRCDQRLDAFGVDPGLKRADADRLLRSMDLVLEDRTSLPEEPPSATGGGCGCSTGGGGGCSTGSCADNGGGGGCWTPALDGRAAEAATAGTRGCGSCGVKSECADVSRLARAGDLDGAAAANAAKKAKTVELSSRLRVLAQEAPHPDGLPNFHAARADRRDERP